MRLIPELQRKLAEIGPEHYARATARDFVSGGKYNPKPKPKYALT